MFSPGTMGLLKVTRRTSGCPATCSTSTARSGADTWKWESWVAKTGSMASSKVKSITAPRGSSTRFWSAVRRLGEVVSPVPTPATGVVSRLTSATVVRPTAASSKEAWTLTDSSVVMVRIWVAGTRSRVQPVSASGVPPCSKDQLAGSSASASTTQGPPPKVTVITSPPRPGFCAPAAVKVGVEGSLVVTAVQVVGMPVLPTTRTWWLGVTRWSQVTVAVVPAVTTVWAV